MAMMVPITKKGPKGISLFKPFLPNKINPIPIIAPIKKAENKAAKIFGKPIKIPIKKTIEFEEILANNHIEHMKKDILEAIQ